ncbi:hypothetical protein R1sor_026051 [Riccia sorocarpa]|uniref:RING-type E3 ubiquitin transferase n=1 Tax=Riccia sorocarpa TaxID=122646 RepID=A0ABD3GAX3_9MARC
MDTRGLIHSISKMVHDTKQLAKEIPVSKSNFLTLAFYLGEVQTVVDGLIDKDQKQLPLDSLPVQTALTHLEGTLDTVYRFIKACSCRSRIFLLYKVVILLDSIRWIVRDLADGLSRLADALPVNHRESTLAHVGEKLSKASFYMEPGHQQMVEDIQEGLESHHVDEPYATGLLRRISELLLVPTSAATELKLELLNDYENSGLDCNDPDHKDLQSLCDLLNPAAVLEDVRLLGVEDSPLARYGALQIYSSFICPITRQLMRDPVTLVEAGFTYEREAILEWFDRGHRTCPDTGKELESLEVVPNMRLAQAIAEFVEHASRQCLTRAIERMQESEDAAEVEDAVEVMKSLSETNPNNKRLIGSLEGIPGLIRVVKQKRGETPEVVEKAMKLMLGIASLGDEYRKNTQAAEDPTLAISSPCKGVSLDIRAEMARAVIELQSNDNGYVLLIKAGVISPLLDLLQNGTEKTRNASQLQEPCTHCQPRKATALISATPVQFLLVKFIPASDDDLRLAIMGALANLATDHQAVTEMDQEGAVSRLLGMPQLVDAPVHDFALKILQCILAGMSEVGGANLELGSVLKPVPTLVTVPWTGGHSGSVFVMNTAAAALSNLVEPGNPGVVQKQLLMRRRTEEFSAPGQTTPQRRLSASEVLFCRRAWPPVTEHAEAYEERDTEPGQEIRLPGRGEALRSAVRCMRGSAR